MVREQYDVSDCYCVEVKKIKRAKATSGFKCQCYIKGKPAYFTRIDLYER